MDATDIATKSAKILADRFDADRFWFASSGLLATGEEIAQHLESVLALLERGGWVRSYGASSDGEAVVVEDLEETASTARMVRHLVKVVTAVVRDLYGSGPSELTLSEVMWQGGNSDLQFAATRCLDLVLQAQLGGPWASSISWSSRPERTFDEVRDLLLTGAVFAREHGPAGVAA
jgi:hypothetical protein